MLVDPSATFYLLEASGQYHDGQQAFTRFRADVGNVTTFAENEFKKSGREISAIVNNALSVPRNALGSLDLSTDKINAAGRDAQDYARSLRQVEQAACKPAKETGDTSEETRIYLQAANAASKEADETARSLTARAAVLRLRQFYVLLPGKLVELPIDTQVGN